MQLANSETTVGGFNNSYTVTIGTTIVVTLSPYSGDPWTNTDGVLSGATYDGISGDVILKTATMDGAGGLVITYLAASPGTGDVGSVYPCHADTATGSCTAGVWYATITVVD